MAMLSFVAPAIYRFWARPKLKIAFDWNSPDGEIYPIPPSVKEAQPGLGNHLRCMRLRVHNRGRTSARGVQVFVEALRSFGFEDNPHGSGEAIRTMAVFMPQFLVWAHRRDVIQWFLDFPIDLPSEEELITVDQIGPGVFRHCNFITAFEGLPVGFMDVYTKPTTRAHELAGGDYLVKVVATAQNCRSHAVWLHVFVDAEHYGATRAAIASRHYVEKYCIN